MQTSTWKSLLLFPQAVYPMLEVGWTLVHEVYFYLVFALIIATRMPLLFALTIWAVSILFARAVSNAETIHEPIFALIANPLTFEFIGGALIGILYRARRTPLSGFVGLVGLLWAVTAIFYWAPGIKPELSPSLDMWRVLLFGMPAALIIYCLAGMELRGSVRVPAWLVTLGDWSYSTYLVHVLIIGFLARILAGVFGSGTLATVILFIIAPAVTYAFSGPVYRLFEAPTIFRLRRIRAEFSASWLSAPP